MESCVMPSHPLPPIAQEAVLKLLAIAQSAARRDKPSFEEALIARERPALRLDGAPLQPVWPMPAPSESARGAKRPRHRPPRRNPAFPSGFGPDREGDA